MMRLTKAPIVTSTHHNGFYIMLAPYQHECDLLLETGLVEDWYALSEVAQHWYADLGEHRLRRTLPPGAASTPILSAVAFRAQRRLSETAWFVLSLHGLAREIEPKRRLGYDV